MNIVRCEHGHFYDKDKSDVCLLCERKKIEHMMTGAGMPEPDLIAYLVRCEECHFEHTEIETRESPRLSLPCPMCEIIDQRYTDSERRERIKSALREIFDAEKPI